MLQKKPRVPPGLMQDRDTLSIPHSLPGVNPTPHFPGILQILTQAHEAGNVAVAVAMCHLLTRLYEGRGGGHE